MDYKKSYGGAEAKKILVLKQNIITRVRRVNGSLRVSFSKFLK